MAKARDSKLHSYAIALFTAVLSAVLSVTGFYFTSKMQARAALEQKRIDYRYEAYSAFIKSVSAENSPVVAQLLNVGKLAKHLSTDAEIQHFEDRLAELSNENFEYKLSLELRSHFDVLLIHGSDRVREICDDIVALTVLRESEIDWLRYSDDVQQVREVWLDHKQGDPYGWESKVSDDERIMVVLLGELYAELQKQLHAELYES